MALIDDVSGQVTARRPFRYSLPVTHLAIEVGDWPTGLYRAVIVPAGSHVDGAVRQFSDKMVNLIVRPARGSGRCPSSPQRICGAPTPRTEGTP